MKPYIALGWNHGKLGTGEVTISDCEHVRLFGEALFEYHACTAKIPVRVLLEKLFEGFRVREHGQRGALQEACPRQRAAQSRRACFGREHAWLLFVRCAFCRLGYLTVCELVLRALPRFTG